MKIKVQSIFVVLSIWAVSSLSFVGCNSYEFLDPPSNDIQNLTKARICFDHGDYPCASQYYSKVGGSYSDQALAETVFEMLAQNGMTAVVFMKAVVSSGAGAGSLVTHLANSIANKAGETTRLAYFHAYQKALLIGNSRIQGLVLFISSIGLLAELLAEDIGSSGELIQTDLVTNVNLCKSTQGLPIGPGGLSGCEPPNTDILADGASLFSLITATDANLSGSPSLTMIDAAMKEILRGVNQMGATAKLGTSSGSFAQQLVDLAGTAIGTPAGSPIYRYTLIFLGIGSN